MQADGKVVVAVAGSSMVVERFNPNGSLDTGFGSGGIVAVPGTSGGNANAVALAPGGKIVVAGSVVASSTLPAVAVARLNPNGSPDASFGAGGLVTLDFAPGVLTPQMAEGLTVQSDGRIVIVGDLRPGLQVTNAFIARLTSSGALDPSFGHSQDPNIPCGGGFCFLYHPGGGAYIALNAVTLQANGDIVAAGIDLRSQNNPGEPTCSTNDCPQALVIRFTTSGAPDTSFGSGGFAELPAGDHTITGDPIGARGVVIAGGGDIVATGDYQQQIGGQVALWAFTPQGQPVLSFGSGGTVLTPLSNHAQGRAITVMADGRLVVAGVDGGSGFVARYLGLGAPPSGSGGGPPAQPPAVQTGASTGLSPRAAQVAGVVNPNSKPASYFFQYGRGATYGSSTAAAQLPASGAAETVTTTLGGLSAGTLYHYRLVASNLTGTSYGQDRMLKTPSLSVSLHGVAGQRIGALLHGLLVSVGCNDRCRVRAYLTVSKSLARQLGLTRRSTTLASGASSAAQADNVRLRLKLARGVNRNVFKLTKLSGTLRVVVSSPASPRALVRSERLTLPR